MTPSEAGAAKERRRIRILFVCLGNICRSPLAEGVFRHLVEERGLADCFTIDSAGTSGWHIGEPPDPRTSDVARRRGIRLDSRARRVVEDDARSFDYLVAMDAENLSELRSLAARVRPDAEVRLLREYDADASGVLDVPDPYFGGARGFEDVHDIVERACRNLLDRIVREHGLA